MRALNPNLSVIFDVDGTLIYQVGENEDMPRKEIVELFHKFEALGCDMYIWSGGGVYYAETWRDRLGLNARVVPKLKSEDFVPDITFDDCAIHLGKVNIRV